MDLPVWNYLVLIPLWILAALRLAKNTRATLITCLAILSVSAYITLLLQMNGPDKKNLVGYPILLGLSYALNWIQGVVISLALTLWFVAIRELIQITQRPNFSWHKYFSEENGLDRLCWTMVPLMIILSIIGWQSPTTRAELSPIWFFASMLSIAAIAPIWAHNRFWRFTPFS